MGNIDRPHSIALIIPFFNAGKIIPQSFARVDKWLTERRLPCTVYWVDDGSTDDGKQLLGELLKKSDHRHRIIGHPKNLGKGAAVREGLLTAAHHHHIGIFTDCDLHYGLEIINDRLLPALRQFDAVILDRDWHDTGHQHGFFRRVQSFFFNRLTAILTGVTYKDTQAGLKGFRLPCFKEIFTLSRLNGFAFDVEVLSLALHYRLTIKQIPVSFKNDFETSGYSTVKLLSCVSMLFDLVGINWNFHRGRYRDERLEKKIESECYSVK